MLDYSVSAQSNNLTGLTLYYPKLQYQGQMSTADFCQHLADHGSVYSKGDYLAMISNAAACIKELALEGYRINMGDFGVFYVSISSEGAESYSDFATTLIKSAKIKVAQSDEFKDVLDDCSFNKVITRAQQAAAITLAASGEDITSYVDTGSDTSSSTDTEDNTADDSTESGDDINDTDSGLA